MRASWVAACLILLGCSESTDPLVAGRRNAPPSAQRSCHRDCDAAEANCGVVDDRCGGVLECGYCPLGTFCGSDSPNVCGERPCQPRLCEPDECGLVHDSCSEMMDCGGCSDGKVCSQNRCLCGDDESEPSSRQTPAELGQFTDTSRHSHQIDDLNIRGREEDWYALTITDDFNARNPSVSFGLTATRPGVTWDIQVFYQCHSGGDTHGCVGGTPSDDKTSCSATYSGGQRQKWVTIQADCDGQSDSGTALVQITRRCSGDCAERCDGYSLGVSVE